MPLTAEVWQALAKAECWVGDPTCAQFELNFLF
jgi:hypothetical protein